MPNFSNSVVNKNFKKLFARLETTGQIKGKSDLARKLKTYNHVINSVLKSERNLTIEQIERLVRNYRVNANFLFGTADNMFVIPEEELAVHRHDAVDYTQERIVYVHRNAMTSYAQDPHNSELVSVLSRFSLPGYEQEYVAFDMVGDSMSPTIIPGDIVVGENQSGTPVFEENHLYILVTDTVLIRRVQTIKKRNKLNAILVVSDNNPMYKPYEMALTDLRHILKVVCRISKHGTQ